MDALVVSKNRVLARAGKMRLSSKSLTEIDRVWGNPNGGTRSTGRLIHQSLMSVESNCPTRIIQSYNRTNHHFCLSAPFLIRIARL